MNLLVPSIGRKVALARLLKDALGRRGGKLIGADVGPYAAALAIADERALLPPNSDAGYWPAAKELCQRHAVTAVLPVRSGDLRDWARGWVGDGGFGPIPGVSLLCSSWDTIEAFHDKWKTAQRLKEAKAPHPRTFLLKESSIGDIPVPCVIKGRYGAGSIQVEAIESREKLDFVLNVGARIRTDFIAQEWIEGEEFSIDCYVGLDSVWRAGVVRRRRTVVGGQIDTGETVRDDELLELAKRVVAKFSFRGPVNIQVIRGPGGPTIIEINPRFPGGIGLTAAAGMDFAEFLIAEASGEKPNIPTDYREMVLLGYAEGVYLPVDEFRNLVSDQ